jgi:prepilin-type N-terminal cleavage/methylation domain-containing protein
LKNNIKGFTLIEVLIVIGLMGILMTVAYPSFSQWQKNAQFKTAARDLSGAMMEARSRAISSNLEHEMVFDLVADTYKLNELSNGGTTVIPIYGVRSFSNAVGIKAKLDCSENSIINYRFKFSPNGTFKVNGSIISSDSYICIVDKASGATKFKVGVPSPATGRVELIK